jgi:ubiquinone/menaquinone biosynthesis C-methylase UbiE
MKNLPLISIYRNVISRDMDKDRYLPNFLLGSPIRGLTKFPIDVISEYLREGSTVADIGCGPGYYSIKLARKGMNLKIFSIDPNPEAIKFLTRKIERIGITGITPICESANAIKSIPDQSVDFVLSHLMLCCMSDHEGAMRETIRVLKRDGVAFISVNKSGSKTDSRDVGKEEWETIKKRYAIIKEGESLISRWFIMKRED